MQSIIDGLETDFEDDGSIDKVLRSGESLTLIFNDGVSREEARETVSNLVFEEHNLEFPDEIHLVTVPEDIRRKDDDMLESRQSIIVSDVEEYED